MEKKNEDLCVEIKTLKSEIEDYEERIQTNIHRQTTNTSQEKEIGKSVVIANGGFDDLTSLNDPRANCCANDSTALIEDVTRMQTEITCLKNDVAELKVQVRLEKWQKEETDSQMQDVLKENVLLHQKVAELHKEILDWESFAQKEECYRRIAEAFAIKHNIETEETFVRAAHCNGGAGLLSCSPTTLLSKAKSCEYLNHIPKEKSTQNIIKGSASVREIILSSGAQSNSLLSELDKEYDALVKRYEALLEKCQQEGKFNENPERTRKVQRAIQTLSLDFSKLTTPIQSPLKSARSFTGGDDIGCCYRASTETQHDSNGNSDDYRKLFSQIFAKLKEAPIEKR